MATIFSAGNDTGYIVSLDNAKSGVVILRISQKIGIAERKEIAMALPALTANMLASFLETEAVRAHAMNSGVKHG